MSVRPLRRLPSGPDHEPDPRPAAGRRARRRRADALLAMAAVAGLATACVGQSWSNDDHVGPTSVRPDPREHTLGPPADAPADVAVAVAGVPRDRRR